jgi:hypothetical protein
MWIMWLFISVLYILFANYYASFSLFPDGATFNVGFRWASATPCTTTALHHRAQFDPKQMSALLSHCYKDREEHRTDNILGSHWPNEDSSVVTRENLSSISPGNRDVFVIQGSVSVLESFFPKLNGAI